MNYTLVVHSAPYTSQSAMTALKFAQTLLEENHTIARVFFLQEGVYTASHLMYPPKDEINIHTAWVDLAKRAGIALDVCISAALRRGVVSEDEVKRNGLSGFNLKPPFVLSGLGQLLDGALCSDRTISFGG